MYNIPPNYKNNIQPSSCKPRHALTSLNGRHHYWNYLTYITYESTLKQTINYKLRSITNLHIVRRTLRTTKNRRNNHGYALHHFRLEDGERNTHPPYSLRQPDACYK